LATACGNSRSVADEISAAELALVNDDADAARSLCNGILSHMDKKPIAATQFAHLSILYMQLNERTDNPEDIGLAARCFREAFRIDADSASAYYSTLPVDQDKYAMTLSSIVHILDNPQEIPADIDSDISVEP